MNARRTARTRGRWAIALIATVAMMLPAVTATAEPDPREGLGAGWLDAETAEWNMELVESVPRPTGFVNPSNPGDFSLINSDLAFSDNHAFMGNYNGALIYDVNDPTDPELRTALVCPGGQGDISVHGDLMFISVQQLGTIDCQTLGTPGTQELRGMRVFDISDLDSPEQVATVQTCRGSHTHTLVEDLNDPDNVYIYVNGTSAVRGDSDDVEGLDCAVGPLDDDGRPSSDPADFDADTETDRYQIEVIQVPVDSPEDAEIVNEPRLFADEETGNPVGLRGQTDACHDITAYPEIGLAAGACEGNGLLIDITDPANPERVDYAENPEFFAYWHSATFNNDGTTVIFTDELGGGTQPRCQPETGQQFGANAIYEIEQTPDGPQMEDDPTYYKIPDVQTAQENCVAHNGSLLPVPGRDIMVQAWYQGGVSVFDFTDPNDPFEIAFFDRGPIDEDNLVLGGQWSSYYYNGYIYGSEIARGLDVFELLPSEYLSEEELDEAAAVRLRDFNPQAQPRITDADRSACAGVDARDFPDVQFEVHRANIGCVAGYGIAQGFADGTFGPAANVRRDQMASFIHRKLRVAGVEMPEVSEPAFDDITTNTHERAISELAELGIVRGRTASAYDPASAVSREQMTSMIVAAVEYVLDVDLPSPRSPFTDVPSGGTHTSNIDAAYEAGLVSGTTATTFDPRSPIRRDQMATLLAGSLELYHYELVELRPLD
jgi:hypothetical protein